MEGLKGFHCCFLVISSMALVMSVIPVLNGQINAGCTTSMITSFTPCLNYITGSAANGSSSPSPTADCCRSLGSVMNTSMDCACLLVNGNVPFRLPINRTLAVSLPRACNKTRVPVQCKATGSPLPAPGPVAFGPTLSPAAPVVPKLTTPALAPQPETPAALSPATTPVSSETPTTAETPETAGIHPVVSPSAANPSMSFSPSLLLSVVGVLVLIYN